jgi:hypothetical protein
MTKFIFGAVAALAAIGFLPGEPQMLVAPAEAIVGRPLSPVSVAGVARRTTRRAVYAAPVATAAVVAAPVATAAVVAAPAATCVTKYDAYGNRTTVC